MPCKEDRLINTEMKQMESLKHQGCKCTCQKYDGNPFSMTWFWFQHRSVLHCTVWATLSIFKKLIHSISNYAKLSLLTPRSVCIVYGLLANRWLVCGNLINRCLIILPLCVDLSYIQNNYSDSVLIVLYYQYKSPKSAHYKFTTQWLNMCSMFFHKSTLLT